MQPHSIEAEQSVLGGLLLSADAWDAVAESVSDRDFYRPDHRLIFRQIARLAEASEPVDVITVADKLEASGELEAAGGLPYLAELAQNTPSASNIRAYGQVVRERASLRKLIEAAQDIADSGFNPEGRTSDELIDEAERLIMQISEQGPKSGGPAGREPAAAVGSGAYRGAVQLRWRYYRAEHRLCRSGQDDLRPAAFRPGYRGWPSFHGQDQFRHEPGGKRGAGPGQAHFSVQYGDAGRVSWLFVCCLR